MPWDIGKDKRCPVSKPWAVTNADTNRLVACHASRDDALDNQRALYANVSDSKSVSTTDLHCYLLVGGNQDDTSSGATFLQQLTDNKQWPAPEKIMASPSATTAAHTAASILGIPFVGVIDDLNDYNPDNETPLDYEARSEQAFNTVRADPALPLVVAHRSTSAFLEHRVRTQSSDDWRPNYARHTVLKDGGVLASTQTGLTPLYRPVTTRLLPTATNLPTWMWLSTQTQNPGKAIMDPLTKSVEADIRSVESSNPNGEFELVLSKDNLDRDEENLWADEWLHPLPSKIHMDTDHAFAKGMSVPYTAGSGAPEIGEDGELLVKGTYAGTPHGQLTRQLVNEGHIWQASVTYQLKQLDDGRIVRELLNGTFTGVPANPEAVVLSSKDKNGGDGNKKPYGSVRYADPGYQSDGQARYPIDTEEHVRAALSYFGQAKNRSKYTPEQQRAILGRIRSAARRLGIDVSDSSKALMWALCKAINVKYAKPIDVDQVSQTTPGHTPGNQDVGARSVYDDTSEDDDPYDLETEGVAPDMIQAVHDAAVSLGAACSSLEHAQTKSIATELKDMVQPVFHRWAYTIDVAGPPGKEVYTLRKGEDVVSYGTLSDLTSKSKKDPDDDGDDDTSKKGDTDNDFAGKNDKTDQNDKDDEKDKEKKASKSAKKSDKDDDDAESADEDEDRGKALTSYVLRLPNGASVEVELSAAAVKALEDAQTSHEAVETKDAEPKDHSSGQSSPVDEQAAAASGAAQQDIDQANDAAKDAESKSVTAGVINITAFGGGGNGATGHSQTLPESADKTPAAADTKSAAAGVTPADLAARAKARLRKFQLTSNLLPEGEVS